MLGLNLKKTVQHNKRWNSWSHDPIKKMFFIHLNTTQICFNRSVVPLPFSLSQNAPTSHIAWIITCSSACVLVRRTEEVEQAVHTNPGCLDVFYPPEPSFGAHPGGQAWAESRMFSSVCVEGERKRESFVSFLLDTRSVGAQRSRWQSCQNLSSAGGRGKSSLLLKSLADKSPFREQTGVQQITLLRNNSILIAITNWCYTNMFIILHILSSFFLYKQTVSFLFLFLCVCSMFWFRFIYNTNRKIY